MSLTGRQAGRCRAIKAHPALPPILVKTQELHFTPLPFGSPVGADSVQGESVGAAVDGLHAAGGRSSRALSSQVSTVHELGLNLQ